MWKYQCSPFVPSDLGEFWFGLIWGSFEGFFSFTSKLCRQRQAQIENSEKGKHKTSNGEIWENSIKTTVLFSFYFWAFSLSSSRTGCVSKPASSSSSTTSQRWIRTEGNSNFGSDDSSSTSEDESELAFNVLPQLADQDEDDDERAAVLGMADNETLKTLMSVLHRQTQIENTEKANDLSLKIPLAMPL